jgi:hypothetical protein
MRINRNVKQILVELLFVIGEFICRLINKRQRNPNPDDDDY